MEEFKFPDEVEAKGEDFEIDIVDDTPEQDQGRKPLEKEVTDPTDEEIESYSDNVKKRIKELTHSRHDERRAKEATMREKQELEQLAQRLLQENKQLKGYVEEGTRNIASTALGAAQAEYEKARREYKAAQEAYDADLILAAQEALTDAKWKMESIKNYRPQPLQTASDVIQPEQFVQKPPQPDDKSLRWQAKNQWFGADGFEEVTSFSLGLHQKLVNSGIDPRSDEYYEQIDARVKNKFPEVFGKTETNRRPASVVAPATRSSGTKRIQMTTTQLALAKKFGLTPQQYAEQVAKMENSNG
jgi:predicted NBD/HSP70 family sugar kinase